MILGMIRESIVPLQERRSWMDSMLVLAVGPNGETLLCRPQVGQTKHSATVVRLDSRFAHDDGLPCRRIATTAQTVGEMQALDTGGSEF